MTRQFIDNDLITWEVHASTGPFSLPADGRLVFLCVTDPDLRPRSIRYEGDLVDTGAAVLNLSDAQLRELLESSREIK